MEEKKRAQAGKGIGPKGMPAALGLSSSELLFPKKRSPCPVGALSNNTDVKTIPRRENGASEVKSTTDRQGESCHLLEAGRRVAGRKGSSRNCLKPGTSFSKRWLEEVAGNLL